MKFLLLACALVAAGCGRNQDRGTAVMPAAPVMSCRPGEGLVNGRCVPANSGGTAPANAVQRPYGPPADPTQPFKDQPGIMTPKKSQ